MKRITCEMCGSNEVVKNDGLFVCQVCGTKYSTAEAKKLMVEVSGKVSVDRSGDLKNLLELGDRYRRKKDYETACTHYEKALRINSSNPSASYYRDYCKVLTEEGTDLIEEYKQFMRGYSFSVTSKAQGAGLSVLELVISLMDMTSYVVAYSRKGYDRLPDILELKDEYSRKFNIVSTVDTFVQYALPAAYGTAVTKQDQDLLIKAMKDFEYACDDNRMVYPWRKYGEKYCNILIKLDNDIKELPVRFKAAASKATAEKYWSEHKEEKCRLLNEQTSLNNELISLKSQISPLDSEILSLKSQRNVEVPALQKKSEIIQQKVEIFEKKKSDK